MSFLSLNGPVHSPLFFLAGLALGLVFASATFSSSVWVVQATMAGGWTAAWRVVCGVSLAQGAWALMASFPLPGLRLLGERFDWPFRAVAAGAFLQLAFAVAGSPALAVLRLTDAERPGGGWFPHAFQRALSMPLRLPGYLSLYLLAGLHLNAPDVVGMLLLGAGVAAGAAAWMGHLAFLALFFGPRVPDPVTLISLNKLRRLAVVVFLGLALIASGLALETWGRR